MKKENNSKKIDSKLLQESLLDYNNLAEEVKKTSPDIIRDLLKEEVKKAYASILNESEEDEDEDEKNYEEEEVDDTTSDSEGNQNNDDEVSDETPEDGDDVDDVPADDETEEDIEATIEDGESDSDEGMDSEDGGDSIEIEFDEEQPESSDEDGIGQDFDDYKVSDNEYDLRNAQDDDIVKVYKRLKDTDNVTVVNDGDRVQLSDNETGAEYIIDLGTNNEPSNNENDNIISDNMNESRIYEIALNEYDSHVGYTDNYQKKDVMSNSGISEPSKHGRQIDKGIPSGTEKPWSKQKKSVGPFTKKTQTDECGEFDNAPIENEGAGDRMGCHGRSMGTKTHRPNAGNISQPWRQHHVSVAGEYKGTPDVNESAKILKKAEKIFEDNKKLKQQLNKLHDMLSEAAVTNVNLGGIIKLISENSTTRDEKRNIINRFTEQVHTIDESKMLYNTIANELKQKPQNNVNINEEKSYSNSNSEIINESKLYQDESLMNSLGLMHKICK